MTFQNVVFFRRNLYYQGKKFLSVCTHFLSGDSLLRSEHADVLKSSVFVKLRKKLRISGHKFDSNSQKNRNFKKVSLLLNDHNAITCPFFFSRHNRLFFPPYFTGVNSFKIESSKFQKFPSFPLWILFRSLGQRNSMKNVMKIWWLEVFDNKTFLAYRKALKTYFWRRDTKKIRQKLS